MKKIYFFILILLALPLYFLWSWDSPSQGWNPDGPSPFKIPGKFNPLLKGYRKHWKRLTSLELSGLHWNQGVVVYINTDEKVYLHNHKLYLKSLEEEEEEEEEETNVSFLNYPPGTIILKENYWMDQNTAQGPVTATVMIKHHENYDPQSGNWEYLQFDPSGVILVQGNSKDVAVQKICSECHHNIAERDYVFSTFYDEETKK